jgi:Secretion system C-terminal sorting domain
MYNQLSIISKFVSHIIVFCVTFSIFNSSFFITKATAQLMAVPIATAQQKQVQQHSNARIQALELPFFDDFSLAKTNRADATLWLPTGGTYVNNTLTSNHPTVNVVTFDGADAAGKPYAFNSPFSEGATDTLTSQSIDLSKITPKDSLYLSFYWQAKGGGELPDESDSLRVQFLTSQGIWLTVWKQKGGTILNTFTQSLVGLRNVAFFHNKAQFRFQTFGRQSGAFDTWHLDYVYLNKGRSNRDRVVKDVACRLPVSSFLKRYSAMPLKQYMINPVAETADSITTDIQNLFSVFNFTTFNFTLRDAKTGRVFQNFRQTSSQAIQELSSQRKSLKPLPLPKDTAQRLTLISKFEILTTDNVSPTIAGVDLRRNDTISSRTVLDDYYAYDDGSAEYAVYMSRPLGRTVVRYVLNQADAVNAVRINLVPMLKDVGGQPFNIQLYASDRGRPGKLLYQKLFKITYPNNRNDFVEFPFEYGVAVKDTFYVGWQQIGQDVLAVGLDRNTRSEEQIYVNLGQEWVPYSSFKNDLSLTYFNGSLLVRPVIGAKGKQEPTSAQKPAEQDWAIYPNPTTGIVRWSEDQINKIQIWNGSGALVRQKAVNSNDKAEDISNMPEGFYIIRLSSDEQSVMKKILLKKD